MNSYNAILIPDKIKVGYHKREDTFTKKLAYVIYYDKKGVLRKETSWTNWLKLCKAKLEPNDFENVPTSGFVLNKDIHRGGYYNSNGRNVVRVYDPRDFEFEITVANLMFILAHIDSSSRELIGELVYAWQGKDLVLMPVNSLDYKTSLEYSDIQNKTVKAKELVAGAVYQTKKQEKLTYLGKFDWYEFEWIYGEHSIGTKYKHYDKSKILELIPKGNNRERSQFYLGSKQYIFIDENNNLVPQTSLARIATCISPEPVSNYAELMDIFLSNNHSSNIVGMVEKSSELVMPVDEEYTNAHSVHSITFTRNDSGSYTQYNIHRNHTTYNWRDGSYWYKCNGKFYEYTAFDYALKNGIFMRTQNNSQSWDNYRGYNYHYNNHATQIQARTHLEVVTDPKYIGVEFILENGKKVSSSQLN